MYLDGVGEKCSRGSNHFIFYSRREKNCKGKCKRMINSNLFIGIIYDPIEGKNTSATDKEDKKVSCEAQG